METRKTLVVCALAIAAFSCSNAVPTPAGIGMSVNLYGVTTVQEFIPSTEGKALNRLSTATLPTELDMLLLLESGDEGATVNCKVHETAPGSYEFSAVYKDSSEIIQYSLSATTVANASAGGVVSVKGPKTGAETYAGTACTVETAQGQAGSIVAHFKCDGNASLNNLGNCDPGALDCDKTLDGDIILFVKNCSK
jgi:hypothetical protein